MMPLSRKKLVLTEEEREQKRLEKNRKGRERYRLKIASMTAEELEDVKKSRKSKRSYKPVLSDEKKEEKRVKRIAYYNKNKEKILNRNKIYGENHKEEIKKKTKERHDLNPNKYKKRYNKEKKFKYYNNNKDKINSKRRANYSYLREKLLNILGNKCIICGITNSDFLTIDHINDNGAEERRKSGNSGTALVKHLNSLGWPEDYIKENYQILCWNHNCTKTHRKYFDIPSDQLNRRQRYLIKLWKEAFNFFGECSLCKEFNLKYLTIDHIHRDGAERRRNGERDSSGLLIQFRKQGWPESLKEDYRFLCYNCNCGLGKSNVDCPN